MNNLGFAHRTNLEYLEGLYQSYQANPDSIPLEWKRFFEGMEFGQNNSARLSPLELGVFQLIQAYRQDGHLQSKINPLKNAERSDRLKLENFGLKEVELDKSFEAARLLGLPGATLRDIIQHLESRYCGTLALDVSHSAPKVREWFYREIEKPSADLSREEKRQIFDQLNRTETLERFIHTRYVGTKRFSVEGADSLLPMLEKFVALSPKLGVAEFVLGMAHRGRVNVLANFMGKALDIIFSEFDGELGVDEAYDGDVKYHLGFFQERKVGDHKVNLALAFNPSHLEAVNPVVCGIARAKQRIHKDTVKRSKVVPILIHGDAAFTGQGVVAETLQMSQLKGYSVGGTVHIIIDNQVGFTADPEDTRSTRYASDPAKGIGAPVLLVNGDDVEACVRAADLALRYRQEFGADVLINLICYRRYGHNEGDEPAFTQPLMYEKLRKHPTTRDIYRSQLEEGKILSSDEATQMQKSEMDRLQVILDEVRKKRPQIKPLAFEGLWKGFRRATKEDFEKVVATGVSKTVLKQVGEIINSYPKDFTPHPKLEKLLEARREMIGKTEMVDWGTAELLAYASLIREGTSVRLSGQDVGRGTFSHRHSLFYDVKTGAVYNPFDAVNPEKEFCAYDSLLSEMAVVGFEYGNSIYDPTFLTIWEAQFGDFSNGAQIIIDQFLSSGETKWFRMSGLVLLLPHGYEGQGPEHSSARLERYLQLCAQDNLQVCNMTTPAQLFHVLRRQIKRDFRKPLIVMSPKSLLRHPKVISSLDDLSRDHFHEVLTDAEVIKKKQKKLEKIILCSGKVYYDLLEAREKMQVEGVAIVRVEQLYPFPATQLKEVLSSLPTTKKWIWVQEEPKNMGAYTFIQPRLEQVATEMGAKVELGYVGRPERASPATGSPVVHKIEQERIINECLR